jgi:hypothetical protein
MNTMDQDKSRRCGPCGENFQKTEEKGI